jgi:beta-lactam-binding protein with PASTA domain
MENLLNKLKTFGQEAYYFLSSRVFWVSFGKILLVTGFLLFLIFRLVKCYGRHGDATTVGKYLERNIKEVVREAEDAGFEVVVTDSIYKDGFPADLVLDQNPAPNSAVKTGRTIYLKITKAAGDLIRLPDIAGRDEFNFYANSLKGLGIKIGQVDTVLDANLTEGTIIQVLIRGRDITNALSTGVQVPQGSAVDFVISKRESDETIVPDSEGKTADEYSFLLSSIGLKLGVVHGANVVSNQNTAKIERTEPAVGTSLKKGTSVDIYLTEGN